MPTPTCRDNLEKCHCRSVLAHSTRSLSAIEHSAFKTIRDVVGGLGKKGNTQFHLHLLDFHQQRTLSVGHEPQSVVTPARDDQLQQRVVEIATPLLVEDGTIERALARVTTLDGRGELRGWAERLLRAEGQPLGRAPSRLEMCLVAQTAADLGDEMSDKVVAAHHNNTVCFKVDDYLGRCDNLRDQFIEASTNLGGRGIAQALSEESLITEKTVAFLIAEHLQFWRQDESPAVFLNRMRTSRPGLAILPFRVLGQYRAAGVWFYEGEYSAQATLHDHIEDACKNASRWLGPMFDRTMLASSSRALLDAMHTSPTGSVAACEKAQQAIRGLWCAKRLRLHPPGGGVASESESDEILVGKLDKACATATLTLEGDAAELLGFEKLEFDCPLAPYPEEMSRAQKIVQAELGVTRGAASSVRKLIEKRTREQTDERIDATAHDLVNALRPIISLSGDSAIAGTTAAEPRLALIHHLARQVEGSAWSMRRMVRNTKKAGAPLDLTDRSPTRADFEFWRESFFTQALACAASDRLTYPAGDLCNSTFRLAFNFAVEGEEDFGRWEDASVVIGADTPIGLPRPRRATVPPWPLSAAVRNSRSKFGEAGQLSSLMGGAVELLRNATSATCQSLQTEGGNGTVAAGVRFRQIKGRWFMRVKITNPYRSILERPDRPATMKSLARITAALEPLAKFCQVTSPPGVASYAYIVSLAAGARNDDAQSSPLLP